MVAGAHDFFQAVLHSFLVIDMAGRDTSEADYGVQGRADIMAHIR